jgi:hypothetical protein
MSASIYAARREAAEAARLRTTQHFAHAKPQQSRRRSTAEEIFASRRADVEAARKRAAE